MSEQEATKTETFDTFSIKFYRNKRIFRSFICSFTIAYLTESPFWFVFAHVMATVFWEWWFFSYRNVKESSIIPEWYLEMQGTNREKVDQYVSFMVNLRRITACLSGVVVLFIYFFVSKKIDATTVSFVGTYTIATVLTAIIAEYTKGIKHFYPNFINLGSRSGPLTRNVSSSGETVWATSSSSVGSSNFNDATTNLSNPLNPVGFFNPISPNYVGRNSFDN
jgi:hypothetical protein